MPVLKERSIKEEEMTMITDIVITTRRREEPFLEAREEKEALLPRALRTIKDFPCLPSLS